MPPKVKSAQVLGPAVPAAAANAPILAPAPWSGSLVPLVPSHRAYEFRDGPRGAQGLFKSARQVPRKHVTCVPLTRRVAAAFYL